MIHDGIPAAGVLAFKDNEVLLVRHEEGASHLTGTYGIPSGRFEEGENYKQVAAREFGEETGLITSVENLKEYPDNTYTAEFKRKDGTVKKFSMKVFVCYKFEGELKSNGETTPIWVEIDKIEELNFLTNLTRIVADGRRYLDVKS